ncbi:hypothetical protein FDUTEX481_01244 [Tolypothrix sp. PCC 7601]|nr:hypothetical protein FDUTEX481_01244 [Tolypothrix sp. PCC 7601]BAY91780.1 hypothetical protein NIES3275_38070 [Microchaete diplosiphon NIES-3275]
MKELGILDFRFWILDLNLNPKLQIRLEKFAQRGEPPHATFRKIQN